jgi:hypothetical protein
MRDAGMPCAEAMSLAMDDEQPGLCHAHCQASQQSADHFQVPAFASSEQLGSMPVLSASRIDPGEPFAQAPWMQRATAPPFAIQHCCFRI